MKKPDQVLLGLDMGYTGCKAVAFDLDGEILASAYREYSLSYPRPGWAVFDSEAIWEHVSSAVREVTGMLDAPVHAISTSAMGEAFTPVDRAGRPVTPSITAFDERGGRDCEELVEKLGAEGIFSITGQPPGPSHPLPKIMWLRKNQPDEYKSVSKFLCFGEYVQSRMGLVPTIDYSMAARSMAFDVHELRWSETMLDAAGVDAELLPEVAPSGTALGSPAPEVADALGLPRTCVVVVGGHDTACGALGAGVAKEGQATYVLGTVHSVCPVVDSFRPSVGAAGFACYPHVVPGRFVTPGYNFTGGSLLRWFRDTFGEADLAKAKALGVDVYDLLTADLPEGPTGLMILPHFSGTGAPWFDVNARGTVMGLRINTGRREIIKAIIEGTTYELALIVRLLGRAGVPVNELHAIGGGAKSAVDLRIRTNIMNCPVLSMKTSEAAAQGAAILAGVGTALYDSADAVSTGGAQVKEILRPDPDLASQYQARLEEYEFLHTRMREIYSRVSQFHSVSEDQGQ